VGIAKFPKLKGNHEEGQTVLRKSRSFGDRKDSLGPELKGNWFKGGKRCVEKQNEGLMERNPAEPPQIRLRKNKRRVIKVSR